MPIPIFGFSLHRTKSVNVTITESVCVLKSFHCILVKFLLWFFLQPDKLNINEPPLTFTYLSFTIPGFNFYQQDLIYPTLFENILAKWILQWGGRITKKIFSNEILIFSLVLQKPVVGQISWENSHENRSLSDQVSVRTEISGTYRLINKILQ